MSVSGSLPNAGVAAPKMGHPRGSPDQLVELAGEYYKAATTLEALARTGVPMSRAPFRLVAIHATELHLSAFLLWTGQTPEQVRSYGHDLAARSAQAIPLGLVLRQRTLTHLAQLTDTREYLMSRYQADATAAQLSQPNRLAATMREVRFKVLTKLGKLTA